MKFSIINRGVDGDVSVASDLEIWAILNIATHLSQDPGDCYVLINNKTKQEIVLIDEN